jgi:protoporphyrinogen oxidase
VILGAGPAGLAAAYRLHRDAKAAAVVLERNDFVGGNAASFNIGGQPVDFGSHRLHPSSALPILEDLHHLLGEDLLKRSRHGRIRLCGRWIHFPLRPLDLMLRLDRRFALGSVRDMMSGPLRQRAAGDGSFAAVLRAQLGPTICDQFYYPYARKIWGCQPEELSGVQAKRRVSAGTFGKLLRKVFSGIPGVKSVGFSHFFYPRGGFGRISRVLAAAAVAEGATIQLNQKVERLIAPASHGECWGVESRATDGARRSYEADYVWSTIPIPVLARIMDPQPASEVGEAAGRIDYRSMVLVYLQLPVDRFSEFDAHYFPAESVSLTRLSEPKNYADDPEPRGRTVLCAELPCQQGDEIWLSSGEDLGRRIAADLERAEIPLPVAPDAVEVRRLAQAYPIYRTGYEEPLQRLDDWIGSFSGLLTYGRQGLFAHDNTHHALYMAYCAVDCLVDGEFDEDRWQGYRKEFETHVVED